MAGFEIHDFDFNKLIQFASKAKGDVFLETPDGDVLNLKSRLTQLLALSSAILTEASMSFLGLGIQPPDPSWGSMLSEARTFMEQAPWMAVFPLSLSSSPSFSSISWATASAMCWTPS